VATNTIFFSNTNFWIAIYGAILSTILVIREFLKGRRSVKVTCNLSYSINPINNQIWGLISIKIVNKGYRPVTVTDVALLLKNGFTFKQHRNAIGLNSLSDILPQKISDGESIEIFFDYSVLQKGLKDFNPPVLLDCVIVDDAEGKRYSGKLPNALKGKLRQPFNNSENIVIKDKLN